jgi:hypothetical protein
MPQDTVIDSATEKTSDKKTATGEPDQDYDIETYDKICEQIKSETGLDATHRQFDQYQGVYIKAGQFKFWTVDGYTTGKQKSEDASKPYSHAVLIDGGVEYSASRGDYFQLPKDHVFEGMTLILTDRNGKDTTIENPKLSDLPDIGDVATTFSYEKGTTTDVMVMSEEHDEGSTMEVRVSSSGDVDAEELVEYIKAKSPAKAKPKKRSK